MSQTPPEKKESEFVRSVMEMTPDAIAPREKKKFSPLTFLLDHIRLFALLACGLVLALSVRYIVHSLVGYGEAEDVYGNVADAVVGGSGENGVEEMLSSYGGQATPDYEASQNLSAEDLQGVTGQTGVNREFERFRSKLYSLKQRYPNLYGWIELPGTNINYPIMQSEDNDYYLDHSYTGSYLEAGSIFADYRCSRTALENKNLILYGHHMANQSMFHALDNFLERDFFEKNGTVIVYTLDGMYTYRIFSVYATDKYYPYITTYFPTDESFLEFAERVKGNSIHPTDTQFCAEDKILTLSTCSNRTRNGRLAVHAVLVSSVRG